jgi:uncharacterized protein
MTRPITRRQALQLFGGVTATAIGLYTWRFEPHWLEFTFPELRIAGLPKALEGKTLAQVSDVHVGPSVDDNYVIESFNRLSALAPDFVAFTGDWITYRNAQQYDQLRRVLEHVPRGRLGTVGILGNHDYGFRWNMRGVAERVTQITKDAGVTLLRNEAATIAGLQFVGLDDVWGTNFDPQPILSQKGEDPATIVLSHNPDVADHPVWGRYQGWILSGHTHGGQCKPPFLPPPLLPVHNRRYTAGPFSLTGSRQMYVSRGLGHLLRVRFNCRPEIPVFRLRAG